MPAAARPSVTRGAVATYVLYGDDRANTYVLGRDDVQRIEEHTGKALAAPGIPRRRPDQAEWARLYAAPLEAAWVPAYGPVELPPAPRPEPVASPPATGSVTPRASGSRFALKRGCCCCRGAGS